MRAGTLFPAQFGVDIRAMSQFLMGKQFTHYAKGTPLAIKASECL